MAHIPWRFDYYTLENLSQIKCSLCNDVFKPTYRVTDPLVNHLRDQNDEDHRKAYNEYYKTSGRKFRWASYFEITSSNKVLKPNVICTYCKAHIDIPVTNKKHNRIINPPTKLTTHLKNMHKIEYKNWKKLKQWIAVNATKYISEIDEESDVMRVNRCKKCNDEIRAENATMFVKHLIDKHHQEFRDFPSNAIPEALLLDYDPDESFEGIPTDLPANVQSTSSNQPSTSRQSNTKDLDDLLEKISTDIANVQSTSSNQPSTSRQSNTKDTTSGEKSQKKSKKSKKPSTSGCTSEEPPSKCKRNSPPQTEEHSSKRKKR